jgi:hypothetical protein
VSNGWSARVYFSTALVQVVLQAERDGLAALSELLF